jgi:ankyrin repeat protein
MYAALHAGAPVMKLLIERGADVNGKNSFGATALMWAAGDREKVRLLVERGAAVNAAAASGRTALAVAAAYPGNVATVRLLLDQGADPKAKPGRAGGPVVSAAIAGDAATLKLLLDKGADADERASIGSRRGSTALMLAATSGCRECVQLLLDHGADVNARSDPAAVVKAGLQDIGELTPLLSAAPGANPAILKALLDKGADIQAKEARGLTALALAVGSESQNAEAVRLLLGRGAAVNVKAKDGETALTWSHKWGDTPIAKLLREAGAQGASVSVAKAGSQRARALQPAEAVQQGLQLLQSSNPTYFNKGGCVGCHHQMLTLVAAGEARTHRIKSDEKLTAEILNASVTVTRPVRESLLQRVHTGGAPMSHSLFMASLAAQNYPADDFTDAIVHELAGSQHPGGWWEGIANRPPLQYSSFSETAYAIRGLKQYASPGRRKEIEERVARAARWLRSAEPRHNEERVMQLLALHWAGAPSADLRAPAKLLQESQQPDGGWAQRSGFPSDAYATGQALYALSRAAAVPASDGAYRRGVEYLLRTQQADGSWHVRSRSLKFQPYFESGFPHGHDQWISAAGTAWAVMALSQAAGAPDARAGGFR